MIIDESFNAVKLIEFLHALIKDADKKVFFILDILRVHHSKPVKAWVAEHKEHIELFYSPSYSPELNPEEPLHADLKQALYTKVPVRTKAKLKSATTEHMEELGKSPERVKKFFHDAHVKYAACMTHKSGRINNERGSTVAVGPLFTFHLATPFDHGRIGRRRIAATVNAIDRRLV